jgi:elongation factor 1-gamma
MDIRIFSYLPNPRIWKATITARLCGVDIDIRGAAPPELPDWLWDFDAHPLTDAERNDSSLAREARTGFGGKLYKTDAFLEANPRVQP